MKIICQMADDEFPALEKAFLIALKAPTLTSEEKKTIKDLLKIAVFQIGKQEEKENKQ